MPDMHKILAALLISVFVAPAGGFAQAPPASEGRGGTIRPPVFQLPAAVARESVNRERVRFAALAFLQQQPKERSWPGRHPVLFGALVLLGAGLGLEAAVIQP